MLERILYDKNFNNIMLNAKYYEPLEHLLDKSKQESKELEKQKLNFKHLIPKDRLPEIFLEVKECVNKKIDFIAPDPEYKYGSPLKSEIFWTMTSCYALAAAGLYKAYTTNPTPETFAISSMITGWLMAMTVMAWKGSYQRCYSNLFSKKINLVKEPVARLIPTLAHEYAHYLQDVQYDYGRASIGSAIEGHARGVERIISEHYAESEDNPAYLYDVTCLTAHELKKSYLWVSKKLKKEPRKSLAKKPLFVKKPGPHAMGNATFYVLEQFHGRDIYKRFLKRDLTFLKGR